MVGSMAHTVSAGHLIEEVTGGLCDPRDTEALVARLTSFLSAGLATRPAQCPEKDPW